MSERYFPNWIEAYLAYSQGHESTDRVRKWCAISVLAACLERRVWLDRVYYLLFPNLYTFIIGKSGLVKKTTSTGIAVNLLREIEGLQIMSERLTANSLIEQLLLSGKKFEVKNETKVQSAVFAYASELSVFMEEVYGDITALLTTFYDCIPNDSSKPWIYGTVGRGQRKIYGPCLNILGASTKTWLQKCIPKSEIEGGFTSRIIFVVENKLPKTLVAWPEGGEELANDRLKLVADLKEIHQMAGVFTPTPAAKEFFAWWYENHMRNVLPLNQDPRMVGYMSRKGDTILKLSMVHSAATGDSLVIERKNLEWAIHEINEIESDWRMAFDGVGVVGGLTHDVMEYVRKKGKIPKRELLEYFCTLSPMTEVLKSIHDLKEMDEITDGMDKKTGVEYYLSPGYREMPGL